MNRFKLFPRSRRPSFGELLGISQDERQVSRKYHLRIVREPHGAAQKRRVRAGFYGCSFCRVQSGPPRSSAGPSRHRAHAWHLR
jgi:hypothetical protein